MQSEIAVLHRRRAPEIVERQAEFIAQLFLHRMPFGGIGGGRDALLLRRQLDGRAMLVGGADRQRVIPARPAEPREDVGGQQRAHQIAQMLDPGNIRQGGGDQNAFHGLL